MDKVQGRSRSCVGVWASEDILYPSELGAMRVRFPKLGWTGYPEKPLETSCKL